MRARPREVNIFNMSLIDILCGALGAFCFMMLVALPYYATGSSAERQQSREAIQDLLADAERLRERLKDPNTAAELQRLIDGLSAQVKQLGGQANQLAYENEQLKKQQEELLAKNATLDSKAKQRKPFAIMAAADDPTQELDLYLEDDLVEEGGSTTRNSRFDPARQWHASGWARDISGIRYPDRGFVVWVGSDTAPGGNYRIFIKNSTEQRQQRTTSIDAFGFGDFGNTRLMPLALITLSPERFWTFVGTMSVDDNYVASFREATQQERDAEWRALMKSEPPPEPTPPPDPTIAPAATPRPTLDPAALERIRKATEERMKQREQQQQSAPKTSAPPLSEDQRRELRERYMRQQQLATPSPSATATPP